ncbi:AAEL004629-PA [Aedes aegypti]|uniref:AAEL004629-PA n=1 Tax=Aedes aegypti TaxID=7159 RepID=Q17CB2_AEDAE|nr:AAEL004629-PA [Aedes aegypti]
MFFFFFFAAPIPLTSNHASNAITVENTQLNKGESPYGYSADYEYDRLNFPCGKPSQVELLEKAVNDRADVRVQYVNYLRASRFECGNDLEKVLRRMFENEAFIGCNYTTLPIRSSRPNLRNYIILNDCMLEAWSDLTSDALYEQFSVLIPKMGRLAYKRQLRARQRKALRRFKAAATKKKGKSRPKVK